MPGVAGLMKTDPLISNNFFLELDGDVISALISVSGLDIDIDVTEVKQVGKNGQMTNVKTIGAQNKGGELSMVRVASTEFGSDAMWKWFNALRNGGIKMADRSNNRKNGSVVVYDTTNAEVARWNFVNAFPSKISTSELGVESNDAVKETITLQYEFLERKK